jgi:hypothetical protein
MKTRTKFIIVIGAVTIGYFTLAEKPADQNSANLTFKMLATTVYSNEPPPVFSAKLKSLDGKTVRMTGSIAPYDDFDNLDKFLLVPSMRGCNFCAVPDASALVFVRQLPQSPRLYITDEPVDVVGTLHLWNIEWNKEDERIQFLFTIDDATVVSK